MNKAKKFLKDKKIDEGYVLSRYDDNSTWGHKLTDLLNEYAQQVSRDRELKLIEWIDNSYGFEEMKGNPDYEFMLSQFNHQNQQR
jgi:hypothetical protein